MTDETDEDRMTRLSRDRYERPLPKRFYKTVEVSDANAILLDGRPVKTPMKAALVLPTRGLAKAVAKEWEAQGSHINPGTMPVTRYANTALDRAESQRGVIMDDIARYAGNDLVCYRADRPPRLVDAQRLHWDPVIDYARQDLRTEFRTTVGVVHVEQPPAAITAVREAAATCDNYRITALFNLTTLTGSALLGLMIMRRAISAEAAWLACHVDEDYQISEWGQDDEARSRRAGRRLDYDGLIDFINLL